MAEPEDRAGQAEDDAAEKAELDRFFSLSLDLLCVAGVDGYFKLVNPAFTTVLGYSEEYLLSQAFVEFVHPDDREATFAAVDQLARGHPVVDFENRYRAEDGRYLWLAWRAASIPEQGRIYAVARDVTEHKKLHELMAAQADELVRSNRELEQFAYIASHDLQAPLRNVRQLAEWISEDLANNRSADKNLQMLCGRVDQMSQLVDDLLSYSRVGSTVADVVSTDTRRLVDEVVAMLGPPEGIDVEPAADLPVFATARSPLEQVLRNLIGNAIAHHDRDRGAITVSARDEGEAFEFRVADDGPGIGAQHHEMIFDMLSTLGGGDHNGTGMGLAIVKRIVEHVGGRVWVESEDRGTTFRFTWPKEMPESAA